jgi:DNA polymerase-3 subunit delta'
MSLFDDDDFNAYEHDQSFESPRITKIGLTDPRLMNFIEGHAENEQSFLKLYKNNNLPHGLVFSGIKGIGKATIAHLLTKFIISQTSSEPDMFGDMPPPPTSLSAPSDDKNVQFYLAGAHPDCLTIERAYDSTKNAYKDTLDVNEIRKITPFLRKTSSEGGWRVVIIDDADTMNRNAQNAILKILEEPPQKTLIILIAHRAGNLIPTIKSRTQTFPFQPLSNNIIADLLEKYEAPPAEKDKQTLITLAEGSIGKAIQLIEEEGIDALATTLSLLKTPLDWDTIHKTADNLSRGSSDKAYDQFTASLQQTLLTLCQCKAKNKPLPDHLSRIAFLYEQKSLRDLINLNDRMSEFLNRTDFANLDKKSTILQAITLIAA